MYRKPRLVRAAAESFTTTPSPSTVLADSRADTGVEEADLFVDTPTGMPPPVDTSVEDHTSVIDTHGTGSSFHGNVFSGSGTYYYPNETIYEGQFKDKTFNGKGHLFFPKLGYSKYVGLWRDSQNYEGQCYYFCDGLAVNCDNTELWKYCTLEDRRFYTELLHGLRPAGRTRQTNLGPCHAIPPGCFDTMDGYYDPESNQVLSYDGLTFIRTPDPLEIKWIKKYCRNHEPYPPKL